MKTMMTVYTLAGRLMRPMLTLALVLVLMADAIGQLAVPYTASGTYQVPTGVSQVTVECWGGGGRGGTRSNNGAGGGGGGGAYARSVLTVTPGTYTVTVGAGSNAAPGTGGSSWFGTTSTIFAVGGASVINNNPNGGVGGAAGSCIGDVVFGGGAGGNGTVVLGGGGGGSSAGTAANGNNGANPAGATAPADGGDGGNGRSGSQGNGLAGSVPGGGGGGAWKTGGMATRNGGAGADGQVIVAMPYTEATCLTTTGSFNSIVDNGCADNAATRVSLPQSGLPTTLGTAAGNARLLSVELIVSHTYRGDLNVTLTSPSGVTRNLWINRNTTGDNIGNPASCPGGAFIFQDGGTALSTIGNTVNNPTGTYAPEQTLAGFSGDPNGTWVLSICDDEALDVGHFRYVRLNFCTVPEITATSSNSPVCAGSTLNLGVTATGTAPFTYAWTGTGTFSPGTSSQNPSVTGAATGSYGITVSNVCGSTNTTVPVTVTPAPSATISYTGSPYCSTGGTASVTRTGTAGGSYSSSVGLSINSSTGAVDLAASTAGTYTVTYTIAASGGCALFQTTASITVTAAPSASISYAGSPYCSASGPGGVTLTGTSGGAFSASPAGLSINASTGEVDPGASTPGTYTVNYDIAAAGGCGAFNTSTSITITGCTYYSQGNGGVNSAIWATTPVGTPIAVTWNNTSSMVIQTGDTITVNANTAINDLTTEATSRLVVNAGNMLNVHGDLLTLAQFTVAAASGEVTLESTAPVSIAITGTVAFNDLTVNASAGVTVTGGLNIFGTLQLNDGTFNASAATVQLRSDATRTGRLGPVDPSASYTGDLTVQRYIPGGATNWRLLGTPVAGETVNDWKDDFFMAGFPGSHYPNFYSPTGSGILWPSVRKYDETVADADVNQGMIGVAGTSEALSTGLGYAVWSGDNLGGTNPFLVDVTGAPNVANTPITLPLTWTNSGNPAADGYNLVSNPLPSPIDFASISLGSDVQNFYWIYNPANGNNATWNGTVGTNGANGIIQSSQGFWLKADGPAVTTTVDESAKVSGNTGGVFGGSLDGPMPMVRLRLASTVNSYSDEAVVVFQDGTPAFESNDVAKFVFSHPQAPQIATRSSDDHNLAISMYGAFSNAITIPVLVNVAVNGTYTVTATEMEGITGLSCITIEDLQTGTITPLTEGASYSFVMLANDNENEPRLLLHATAPVQRTVEAVSCNGQADGSATVTLPGGNDQMVTWMTAFGQVIAQQTMINGTATINGLEAGNYSVSVAVQQGCPSIINDFTLTQPFALEVQSSVQDASCPDANDGVVVLEVLGGTAPHTSTWSNGANGGIISAAPGTYTVLVTDANGCTTESTAVVGSAPAPVTDIVVDQPVVMLGTPILFSTTANDLDAIFWDLGDGTTSTEPEFEHTYSVPGTYIVTQTLTLGACTATASAEVEVELTTGAASGEAVEGIRAWVSAEGFVVDIAHFGEPVLIELRDAAGRLHATQRAAGVPSRIIIPHSDLATGIWLINVREGNNKTTFRLPLIR
ncbi:MAG: proprotein convertase P-domain-containing protein [Flavobacteriales bacterium]|nr:proprotein convertase P-domain-containing protein [Flavobacteriales bacterium]